MNWTRKGMKARAKLQLQRQYWMCFLACLLLGLTTGSISISGLQVNGDWNLSPIMLGLLIGGGLISTAISVFVGGPLQVGTARYFIAGTRGIAPFELVGSGFRKEEYGKNVGTILVWQIILVLWSLLLVIPGIVKAYEYYFVPYLLAERPELSYREARDISSRMTRGHKWNMFVLDLSFLGWYFLGFLCCGIGMLLVAPYVKATFAQLYQELKVITE